jgi:hypothetical protein
MTEFDEWFDTEYKGIVRSKCYSHPQLVSREQAKVIWEAAQNVIKGQMIKALIPKIGG